MFLAPLNYDRFFSKVFSDEKIVRRFLEDCLDVKIEEFKMLKNKHKVTDDAAAVEFDFRCKIDDSYVIIDMQQWYKWDVVQRFYIYHALNSGLQLEELPFKNFVLDRTSRKLKKVKDYRALEPVITLIWMVVDSLGSQNDYLSYSMAPETVTNFIKDEKFWHEPEILSLMKERARILEVMNNGTKDLDFLPKNRLIFMFQQNIVRNKALEKYERWFEFAEKTRNKNNKEEDFKEFMEDKTFSEVIKRLNKTDLTEDDIIYIDDEKEFWEESERFEKGIYQNGKKEGRKEGKKEGIKEGIKEGRKDMAIDIALNLNKKDIPIDIIAQTTGLSIEELEKLFS
jgi:hypothetical protein